MNALYLVGVIGLGVALLALLFDGALDLPDTEWFTIPGLAAAVATFGFGTGFMEGVGLRPEIAYVVGAVAALGVLIGTSWLLYKLRHHSTGPDTSAQAMLGVVGTIVTPIAEDGIGQIEMTVNGERRRMSAIATGPVDAGQRAEIVEIVSLTCVRVSDLR